MTVQEKVRGYISENRLMKPDERVLVGVSGGADSVALLLVLTGLGYGCVAVHCNFHLRGEESDRDQRFVEELCEKLGVRLFVRHYDTAGYAREHRCSIEMAARELRYGDFEALRVQNGCAWVAVAHHRDDSVETVLMNLIRGTGIRGLTGIRPRNGYVVRPMLCLSHAEIVAWLDSLGQSFVTDSTNLLCDCRRNRIRNQLLPLMRELNPDADNSIAAASERLRDVMDIYQKAVGADIARCVELRDDGIRAIGIGCLLGSVSPESLLFEILSPYGFNESQITEILNAADAEPGTLFESPEATLIKDRDVFLLKSSDAGRLWDNEIRVRVKDGSVTALPDGSTLSMEILPAGSDIVRDPSVAMLDADRVGDELTLRRWRAGDSFVPFGMKGRKLVSDYLTDCKMNLFRKREQLVLCDPERIVWLVGQRIDNRCRVGEGTGRILKLYLSRD